MSDWDGSPSKHANKTRVKGISEDSANSTSVLNSIDKKLESFGDEQQKIREEQRALRDSLEARLNNISKGIKETCKEIVDGIKEEFQLEFSKMNNILDVMEGKLSSLQKELKEETISLRARIERVEERAATVKPDFDPEVTVVCYGLGFEEEENLEEKVRRMISGGLHLDLDVVATMRTPTINGRPGIVKIELKNLEEKITMLRNKSKLSEFGYKKVFLRSAQTHAERVMDHNTRIMLREMGVEQKYRVSGNGKMIARSDERDNNDRGRREGEDQDGYQMVGPRGRGGRGGHGERGERGREAWGRGPQGLQGEGRGRGAQGEGRGRGAQGEGYGRGARDGGGGGLRG
jgi:DNA-binding Lrp family transcriptional regulator